MHSLGDEDTQDLEIGADAWWRVGGNDPSPEAGEAAQAQEPSGRAHELAAVPGPRATAPSAGLRTARTARPARAAAPGALAPARALAGAAVAVAGVLLGIGTLLWASDAPDGPGPVVTDSAAQSVDVAQPPVAAPAAPSAEAVPSAEPAPSPSAAAAAPPPAPAPPAQAEPASVVVPVTVLNNSRRTGLADRAAARFEAGGWPVRETGNYTGRLSETTVYYAPGQEAAARQFAATFQGIPRVLPRFDTLPGQGLTVVLTRDFPA